MTSSGGMATSQEPPQTSSAPALPPDERIPQVLGNPPQVYGKEACQQTPALQPEQVQGPIVFASIPHGFKTPEQFEQFGRQLYTGLRNAGYTDAQAVLQGSAVTGRSADTGVPFDVGRTSDFDVGVASETAFVEALDVGLNSFYKTGPERIGPIKVGSHQAVALGINSLLSQLSQQYGRDVNIMLYPSLTEAYSKRSYPIPSSEP